ncbi:MAG: YfcC family protein [Gemmatimonadales bacterium]
MKFPHPLALLVGCIAVAAALTWVLPAGQYDRRYNAAAGREVVVAGTYHRVERAPVSPFAALVAIPRGAGQAASVIFLVLLTGSAFSVVDRTGAFRRAAHSLTRTGAGGILFVIALNSVLYATGGALENMAEEIIALVPALLLLTTRMGLDPLVAVAMSCGAAAVGSAFSPINPFQVGIAQKLAALPLLSGSLFRMVFLVLALGIWIWATYRYALRTRTAPAAAPANVPTEPASRRDIAIWSIVAAALLLLVLGVMKLGWDFDQLSADFFAMGVVAGLVGGLGVTGTARAFGEGFGTMAYAAMIIGFARGIFVVLADGRIIDTIVQGVFTPLAHLPVAVSALGMMIAHVGLHFPVPSVSGQAVLTMPVLVPLADLLGLSRQVVVLAYQYGAGLAELVTPTNGAMMAIVAAAGVSYEKWLRFAVPWMCALLGLGAAAILLAVAVGLR